MASEIHSVLPAKNMNLLNETMVYDVLSASNFHQHLQDYMEHHNHHSREYPNHHFNGQGTVTPALLGVNAAGLSNLKFVDPNLSGTSDLTGNNNSSSATTAAVVALGVGLVAATGGGLGVVGGGGATGVAKAPYNMMMPPPPPLKMVNYNNNVTCNNNNNNNNNTYNNHNHHNNKHHSHHNNGAGGNHSNNSRNFDRRDRYKTRNHNSSSNHGSSNHGNGNNNGNAYRSASPRGYDSDESSCTSYSSRETTATENIGGSKYRAVNEENTLSVQTEIYERYGHNSLTVFQPSLYQPNTRCNRTRYQSCNNNVNNHSVHVSFNNNNYNHSNNNHTSNNGNKCNNKNVDVMLRRAHGLMERFKSRADKMKINPNPPELLNGGPWDQLNAAIWEIFMGRIQKEETYLNKIKLWRSIFLYLRKCLTSYGLFLVGSTMSGFGLDGSDIDMCLLTRPVINDARVDSLHHLSHLRTLLTKGGIASDAELVMAKVPILKFKNKESGFDVDLNCNNSVGIRNTHLLHCYAQLDWRVKPLVVVVKLWAQANNINDAKNMTISSYSWALMVIHYLQSGVAPPVLPCLHGLFPDKFNSDPEHQTSGVGTNNNGSNNSSTSSTMDVHEDFDFLNDFRSDNSMCLGDLLVGFFQYYAHFDYAQYAVSVRAGCRLPIDECRFLKTPKNDPNQWKCLCIEEPFDFSNTARSVFDPEVFKHIKNVVMCSYKELARNKVLAHILPVNLNRHPPPPPPSSHQQNHHHSNGGAR